MEISDRAIVTYRENRDRKTLGGILISVHNSHLMLEYLDADDTAEDQYKRLSPVFVTKQPKIRSLCVNIETAPTR